MAIFGSMKRIFLMLSTFVIASVVTNGQSLTVTPALLQFGFINEVAADSQQVMIYNHTPHPVQMDVNYSRSVYADQAFRMNPAQVSIAAFDSVPVWVVFHPIHNVDYSGHIVWGSHSPAGAVAIEVQAHGRYSKNYYSSTEGLSEESLKTALNTLLAQNFTSLSYNGARDVMYASIDNVNGDVECVYTGRTATFNTRAGATANNMNCEHTFPQGFFNSASPMKNDIHHLFPSDAVANSTRNNHPFGVVANPTWQQGGSKYGSSTFEPRDEHKGAAARAMLYFVIRYQDYANFFAPQESILKSWNSQFAPTAFEIGRNNDIYQIQNNRNPFVDYPQMAQRIHNFVTTSVDPAQYELSLGNDTIFLPNDPNANYNVIYRTAVMNTGNVPVFVQPLPTGLTNFTYVNSTDQSETLLPGEAKTLELMYPHSASFNGDSIIQIATNLPTGTIVIPVRSTLYELSVEDLESKSGSILFPNPASEFIQLPDGIGKVEVFQVNGLSVYKALGTNEIDVRHFVNGTYLIQYEWEGEIRSERVLVLH